MLIREARRRLQALDWWCGTRRHSRTVWHIAAVGNQLPSGAQPDLRVLCNANERSLCAAADELVRIVELAGPARSR